MSKCWLLTKLFLKTNKDAFKQNNKKKKFKFNDKFNYILMIMIFLPFSRMIGSMVSNFYDKLSVINQQGIILGMGFAVSSFIIFFFGLTYSITTMYFSKDLESILPLPFKPWEIVVSKFTTILIYEYLTEVIFMIPILVTYGIKSSAGILYYIYSTIIFLTLPVVPLVIGAIIIMLIMSFTSIAKNKDRFKKISGILSMLLVVFINAYLQKLNNKSMDTKILNEVIKGKNNVFIDIVTKIFPSTKFAALSAINSTNISGILNLLIFILISAVFIAVFIVVAEKLYFKGAIGIFETNSKRKKLSYKQFNKNTVRQGVLVSYIKKELKVLFRTPTYFYNCIVMNFLWPVFVIIPIIIGENQGIHKLLEMAHSWNDPSVYGLIIASAISIVIFIGASNPTACTSISREGNNIYICKYIPVSFKTQIMAKILSSGIIIFVSEIIMLLIAATLFKLPLKLVVVITLLSILAIAFINMLGILFDLHRPKLNWSNEQKVLKQNFNSIFQMLLSWVFVFILMFIVGKFQLTMIQTVLFILVLFGTLDLILYYIISTKGVEKFSKLSE